MTIREYITDKLVSIKIPEAVLNDFALDHDIDLSIEYDSTNQQIVGIAICGLIEELILMPRMGSVSENGFSVSWDYASIGQYYLWLCRKWKVTPNKDTLAALGLNAIIDRTSVW